MKRVCIDVGHDHKSNQSPNYPQYIEGQRMWKLKDLLVEDLLQYEDIEVVLTKSTVEENPSLATRGQKAKGCDLFISLHSNAEGGTITGTASYVLNIIPCSSSAKWVIFAEDMASAIAKAMGVKANPVISKEYYQPYTQYTWGVNNPPSYKQDFYGVIRNAVTAGCKNSIIIEHSFHTNKKAVDYLMNDRNLLDLAVEEAQLIADFLGCKRKPKENPHTGADVEVEIEQPKEEKPKKRPISDQYIYGVPN